ncbi:MAG: hypothetical protein E4G74_00285 [Erysipelotrichales bacterium]|nr:MAG: hypothetical protein E4G74_00285 [Erysipelotrichales bacterium]
MNTSNAMYYRLVINFERGEELADFLNEVGLYFDTVSIDDPEILTRVSTYAETAFPFAMEQDNDND